MRFTGIPEMSSTGFHWLQFVPQTSFLLKDFSHWGVKTREPALCAACTGMWEKYGKITVNSVNLPKKSGIKKQLHKEDLGYSTDCQPGVVLYKKVELGQPFCIYIHFVVVSFQIFICIVYLYISGNYKMFTETILVGTLDGIGPTTKCYWENSC